MGKINVASTSGSLVHDVIMSGIDLTSKKLLNISRPDIGKVEKEGELIGMLSKQLYLAGNQMQRMQVVLKKAEDRLKTKDVEIGRLKRKVREWEINFKNQNIIHKKELQKQQLQIDNADYIHKKYIKLETKIFEMEKFLSDYGLVWVGEKKSKGTLKNSEDLPNDIIKKYYSKIISNIEDLNLSVGKGEMHVCHNQGGAVFKSPSCMTLKFYKNGLIVKKGKLRSYNSSQTKSFIQDILDGYFPSELQRDYPNGVPFKVEDHRMENYLGDGANYPGHGYQLGKQSLSQIRQLALSSQVKIIPKVKSTPDAKQSWNINNLNCSSRPSLTARDRPETHEGTYDLPKTSSARLIDFGLSNLRSQILASHNNNCSDSHLRSHMNAEFSLSTKTDKRIPMIPQSTECILPIKEQHCNVPEKLSNISPKKNKTCRISSIERTTFSTPVSRQSGTCNNRIRSRSASLTGNSIKPRSPLRLNTNDNLIVTSKNIKTSKNKNGKLRISKSMTLNKNKCELPLVREINSASDKFGELRLKVRSMNGSTVYLVHLTPDDTVARLYQLLDTAVNFRKRPTVGYKILISGYSPKRLDHFGFTLRDYGISRDCVLHLVND
ncbi:uncharacterized protein LOC122854442 isoform X2 [Aphidius gifuensis]|uniref:uncharacterized protein LOC122854442 isoform X2 n=1 Tax=Aphidius gifuensis TaxID=684658 RepID=UPI001CDC79E7|nr:uncharacterized protein LOC122854442 isoform X2 [Aphidius gifuensis]